MIKNVSISQLLDYIDNEIWSNEEQIRQAFEFLIQVIYASDLYLSEMEKYIEDIKNYAKDVYDIII